MYAFKIVVTTLTLCMMIIECYAGAKTVNYPPHKCNGLASTL